MMYTKKIHSLTIFSTTHFLCAFLDIWRKFCDRIMQLKVDNILNSHYVMKLMHIWTMQWFIGVHFWLARTCHKDCNITKGLRNISFINGIFHIQKDNHNEQSFQWNFLICFKDMMFMLDDKQMFSNTLCYDNVDDYYFF
jgi:hypothetical protein